MMKDPFNLGIDSPDDTVIVKYPIGDYTDDQMIEMAEIFAQHFRNFIMVPDNLEIITKKEDITVENIKKLREKLKDLDNDK